MKRVAIIGGGLAGLTCAYTLRRRGIDATVFEAAAHSGGRATAVLYLLSPDLFQHTFRLIDELGLRDRLIAIPPNAGQAYRGRVYHHRVASPAGLLSFKGLGIADKAMLPRMAYLLAKYSSRLHFHKPELGIEFDQETVAAFVKRELSQNVLNYVAGPLISTLFFYGSEETSAWLYLVLAKHMYNVRMSTLRGGLKCFLEALSNEVRIVTNCAVRNIAADGTDYIVESERFSNVVIAVPGDAVMDISGIDALVSEEDQAFFRSCRYQRVLSARVATPQPVDGQCYAVSIPRVEKNSATTISFHDYIDPSGVPPAEGLLTITGGGGDITHDDLLAGLRRLYPIEESALTVQEWSHGMPKFPAGRFREVVEFWSRRRPSGLQFCGDYLMGPLVEGAIATGVRAAGFIP